MSGSIDRFKSNMEILLDIISEMFQEGSDNGIIDDNNSVFNIIKVLILSCSCEKMVNNFIKKTHEHWDNLKSKDIEYFKEMGLGFFNIVQDKGLDQFKGGEGSHFLDKLKGSHIESFKKLLESSYKDGDEEVEIFDEERKEDVWNILHSFVRISIVYIHEKRGWKDGKYTNEFFPEIKVKSNVEKWGIKSIRY